MTKYISAIARLGGVALLGAIPMFAFAQLGAKGDSGVPMAGMAMDIAGKAIPVEIGDVIQFPDGRQVKVTSATLAAAGTKFQDISKGGGGVVSAKNLYFAVALYPLSEFSVAGPLAQNNNGGFLGGAKTISGYTGAAAIGKPFNNGNQLLEAGGFYFRDYQDKNDLYQIYLRGMFTREWGLQVAYLNSTKSPVTLMSAYAIFDLSSLNFAPGLAHPWDIMFGAGVFTDFGLEVDSSGTNLVRKTTSNFSGFMQGSLDVGHHFSLLLSYWYVRDRNSDNSRLAMGMGYRF